MCISDILKPVPMDGLHFLFDCCLVRTVLNDSKDPTLQGTFTVHTSYKERRNGSKNRRTSKRSEMCSSQEKGVCFIEAGANCKQ